MKVIAKLLLGIFAGIALHQTASITHRMESGVEELVGTTIGVVGTYPVVMMWHKYFGGKFYHTVATPTGEIVEKENDEARNTASYFVAYLCVGAGVGIGWVIDAIFKIDRGSPNA